MTVRGPPGNDTTAAREGAGRGVGSAGETDETTQGCDKAGTLLAWARDGKAAS